MRRQQIVGQATLVASSWQFVKRCSGTVSRNSIGIVLICEKSTCVTVDTQDMDHPSKDPNYDLGTWRGINLITFRHQSHQTTHPHLCEALTQTGCVWYLRAGCSWSKICTKICLSIMNSGYVKNKEKHSKLDKIVYHSHKMSALFHTTENCKLLDYFIWRVGKQKTVGRCKY
jgi:hypothetical protein